MMACFVLKQFVSLESSLRSLPRKRETRLSPHTPLRAPSTSDCVVVVQVDDSEAVYSNGRLQVEGYVLGPATVLAAVGITAELLEADLDWFEEQGRTFPENMHDIEFRK